MNGAIREDSPARDAVAWEIGAQINVRGGVALIIDYGHARSGLGETLQAVRGHRFADVLANPGEQDLTAHVDFEALAKAASVGSVEITRVVSQGEWLERLGIGARAEALAKAHPGRAEEITASRTPVRSRCDGPAVQGPGDPFGVMAGAGGFRAMTVRYRMATPVDAERLVALFHDCFRDTFGICTNLKTWRSSSMATRPSIGGSSSKAPTSRSGWLEEGDELAGFIKLGPLRLPVEPRGPAVELRQLYVLGPWQGSGRGARADGLGDGRGAPPRR